MLAHRVLAPRQVARIASVSAAAFVSCVLAAGSAHAQNAIGGTVVVKNDVRSQHDGKTQFIRLAKGAHVFQDDLVRTRANSLTKIVFLDKTNMSVGPDSEAKLDRFVYNGNETARDIVVEATKGAFRFFSGKSESKAYRILTPQAVIGVRGTTYDVRITPGNTLVVLQEGEVNVCVRNSANCRSLNQPGQSVNVNDNGIADPLPPASKPWDFASNCSGATSDLCNKTTRFALAPLPSAAPPPPKAGPRKASPPRVRPKRRVTRPPRVRPGRRVVRRPPREYFDDPVYVPPPRRPIVEVPDYRPPRRCYPGSRHPRCRIVRPPRPCYGVYRRGRCIDRPVVRPRPTPCRGYRCGVRPPPTHGRPIYRPRPPQHGRPVYRPRPPKYGRPAYRPRTDYRRRESFRGRSIRPRYGNRGSFRSEGDRRSYRSR